jgi:hypothetical protein
MPPQILRCRLASTRPFIQILATTRAQALAVLDTQRPLWKLKDNIFPHIGRQVHEVLPMQFLVKDKLADAQWEVEFFQAAAASQGCGGA